MINIHGMIWFHGRQLLHIYVNLRRRLTNFVLHNYPMVEKWTGCDWLEMDGISVIKHIYIYILNITCYMCHSNVHPNMLE